MNPIFVFNPGRDARQDKAFLSTLTSKDISGVTCMVRHADVIHDDMPDLTGMLRTIPSHWQMHIAMMPIPIMENAAFKSLPLSIAGTKAPFPQAYPNLTDPLYQAAWTLGVQKTVGFFKTNGELDRLHGMRLCNSVQGFFDAEWTVPCGFGSQDFSAEWIAAGCTDDTILAPMAEMAGQTAVLLKGKKVSFPVLDPRYANIGSSGDRGVFYNKLVDAVGAAAKSGGAQLCTMDMNVTDGPFTGLSLAAGARVGGWSFQLGTTQTNQATTRTAVLNGFNEGALWGEVHVGQVDDIAGITE